MASLIFLGNVSTEVPPLGGSSPAVGVSTNPSRWVAWRSWQRWGIWAVAIFSAGWVG